MRVRYCSGWFSAVALAAVAVSGVRAASGEKEQEQVRAILQASGIRGGLVVHVGCGDGRLTAALRVGDGFVVHGLDADPANVARARRHIQSLGLYGPVSVDRFDGRRLPYIDNMVNLIVADGEVPEAELLRVLAPRGVACVKRGGTWSKTVKPWPAGMDEWTHFSHDPTGNAVSRDRRVGPPRHYQWVGAPNWLRHHDHMSGLSAMVSARGRLFAIIDLGPRWSIQMPPRWTLVARDAFNGVVLWQRPLARWHVHLWPLKRGPAQITRRLVAVGDSVYVTLGVGEPVTALDAATGQTVRTYPGSEGTEEIVVADGVLYLVVDPQLDAYRSLPRDSVDAIRAAGRDWNWDERPRRLIALDAATGRVLWQREQRVAPTTLAVAGSCVYFHDGQRVVAREARSGERLWASEPLPRWKPMHVLFGPPLVVYQHVVLFAGGEKMTPTQGGRDTMTALAADTGQVLWKAPHPPSGYASPEDLLVLQGLVWTAATTSRRDPAVFVGRDPRTGQIQVEFGPDDDPHMPHHRCYPAKATDRFILTSRTGIEFVDPVRRHWTAHHWVRGSCNYGVMPANGLVYAPPHSCACYLLAKLNGFNALAAERESAVLGPEGGRLEPGPAPVPPRLPPSAVVPESPTDWPTYRHDAARSGATGASVPAELTRLWHTRIGGRLTPPVAAGGKVFLASIDTHTLYAIDADTGRPVWQFTAGGRLDSPPTVAGGRVLFGSRDGWIYCLAARDGQPRWRFRAAPADQRMMAYGQLESVWPVPGSVLVHDGVVFAVAGRTMWLDGGLRLVRLDLETGRPLSETVLDDRHPETGKGLQDGVQWPNLPVALPDVLSCDGQFVYMRSQPFDLEGYRCGVPTPRNYTEQAGETAHLFSPTGFLDDAWWHRSYWLFGRSFISGAGGWYLATYQAPAGRILAVDGSTVYGFGRAPLRFTGTPNGYHLFACPTAPELINPAPNRPPRRQGTAIYGRVVPTRIRYRWSESVPLLVRGLVATRETLFVAGPPSVVDETEVYHRYGDARLQAAMAEQVAAFEGRKGGVLLAVAKADGSRRAAYRLPSPPVFDGLAAVEGRLVMATQAGSLLGLGPGNGQPLAPAPDVTPGPVPRTTGGLVETATHPDFQHLATVRISPSELGYRIRTASQQVGLALRKLPDPITGAATFQLRVRPRPGAKAPDDPGNAFLAFGPRPEAKQLVQCGFRISGQRLYIVQGSLRGGSSVSTPVDVRANEIAELTVVVDLASQQITASMHGQTVTAKFRRRVPEILWVGYAIHSVDADFGPIRITRQ